MREMTYAIFLTAGILLAGSDGAWFPWINIAGVALFAVTAIIVNTNKTTQGNLG